jgi:hypothetical protein
MSVALFIYEREVMILILGSNLREAAGHILPAGIVKTEL